MNKIDHETQPNMVKEFAKMMGTTVDNIEDISYCSEYYDDKLCMELDVYLKESDNYTRFVCSWEEINFDADTLPDNIVMQ